MLASDQTTPTKDLSFYTQALDVTADSKERAALLELAGIAANRAVRYEPAMRDLALALEALVALGDRSGAARGPTSSRPAGGRGS